MPVVTPTAFSGVSGNVTIASVIYSVREWKMSVAGDAISTTSTGDGGWKTNIVGPVGGEGTFKINADCATQILTSVYPIATQCGTNYIAAVFGEGNSGHSISCNLRITKVDVSNPAEEVVDLEFSYVTTGAVTYS